MKKFTSKPVKQVTEKPSFDKAKNLILTSVKIYKIGTKEVKRIDNARIDKKIVAVIKKLKRNDVGGFRKIMYPFTRVGKLNIDSQAEKQLLCSHARARQVCFNPTASAIGREDLIVNYHNTPAKKEASAASNKKEIKKAAKLVAKKVTQAIAKKAKK